MKKNSKKINKVKKEKIKAMVFKILFTVGVSALLILWALLNTFAYYENIFSCLLNVSLTLLVFLLIVLAIWNEKFRSFKVFIVILIAFFIRIGHGYYYDVLSMKFEPLMHLKIKYGFEFKDMQIIESYKASEGFITPPTDRGAF